MPDGRPVVVPEPEPLPLAVVSHGQVRLCAAERLAVQDGTLQWLRSLGPPLRALQPFDETIVQEELRSDPDFHGLRHRRGTLGHLARRGNAPNDAHSDKAEQVSAGAAPES